jgi:hypothetical protein
MAGTTWNPADLLNVTLSNGNLRVTTTGSGNNGVRTIDLHSAGQYYYEFICTTWGPSTAVGFATAAANLSTLNTTSTGACYVAKSVGTIAFNGSNTGVALGARANGDIIGVALDVTGRQVWFRVSPSGNWNGNAAFSPGGSGGINISAISPPFYGLFCANGNSLVVTANFGDSAFTGAVPSGYTAGFPAGGDVVAGTAQARALILA